MKSDSKLNDKDKILAKYKGFIGFIPFCNVEGKNFLTKISKCRL